MGFRELLLEPCHGPIARGRKERCSGLVCLVQNSKHESTNQPLGIPGKESAAARKTAGARAESRGGSSWSDRCSGGNPHDRNAGACVFGNPCRHSVAGHRVHVGRKAGRRIFGGVIADSRQLAKPETTPRAGHMTISSRGGCQRCHWLRRCGFMSSPVHCVSSFSSGKGEMNGWRIGEPFG